MNIDKRLQAAVQSYWDARRKNKEKQVKSGKIDAGTRGEVTGGTQMGALEVLVSDILCEAGLKKVDVRTRTALELPGYFRATKKWDLIVVSDGALVLAMEFKSQAGKSIGNNVNNRSEEAVGSAKESGQPSEKAALVKLQPHSLATCSCWKIAITSKSPSSTRSHTSL